MKRIVLTGMLVFFTGLCLAANPGVNTRPLVLTGEISGPLNMARVDTLDDYLQQASNAGAQLLVIRLNSPGGTLAAMKRGVDSLQRSSIPVVIWVPRSGDSASGTAVMWMMAAHWAAMAPGTAMGGTPRGGGAGDAEWADGQSHSETLALLRNLVVRRGSGAPGWAESIIWQSERLSAEEALKVGLIDLVSPTMGGLVESLNGREAQLASGEKMRLNLAGAEIQPVYPGAQSSLLTMITNPNIAYVLLVLGLFLLLYEIFHPGAIVPGVMGFIMTALGLIGLGTLPLNPIGLILIMLAMVLFFLEIKFTSWGLLAVGGLIAMISGSLILIDVSATGYASISLPLVIGASLIMLAFFVFVLSKGLRIQQAKPVTGTDGMMGVLGRVTTPASPRGKGMVRGEYWDIQVEGEALQPGDSFEVIGMNQLVLRVRKSNRVARVDGDNPGAC